MNLMMICKWCVIIMLNSFIIKCIIRHWRRFLMEAIDRRELDLSFFERISEGE